MKVSSGKHVRMEYELRVDGGDVIESSESRGPLVYVHGEGQMLAGLEAQIEGLGVGDEKDGVIEAAEAYGTEESLPTKVMPRSSFPEEVEVGKPFEATAPNGQPISFSVVKIDGDDITVRFNHPLAGKNIRYRVKILAVSDGPPPPPPLPPEAK